MSDPRQAFIVDKSKMGHWRITLDNPPINVIDNAMYDAFYDLVDEIEADAKLKVVTFESANPDFFIAHYGTSGPPSALVRRPGLMQQRGWPRAVC
jgi:enoyl-CoA hydratase/carnithine racemase